MRDMVQILAELPQRCYGMVGDQVVMIRRGYPDPAVVTMDPGLIDVQNQHLGVNEEQRAVMERGVTFGWHSLQAPTEGQIYNYRICVPLVAEIHVRGRTDEWALSYAASELLDLPDHISVDGNPSIISKEEL